MSKLKGILLTQGMHGMISQVEGLAKALDIEFTHQKVELNNFWNLLPPKFTPVSQNVYKKIDHLDFDIIISCGRKSVIPSIHLKSISNKKVFNIHIQDPKVDLNHFDFVIAPEHDGIKGSNVITTKGAIHYLTTKEIEDNKHYLNSFIKLTLLFVEIVRNLLLYSSSYSKFKSIILLVLFFFIFSGHSISLISSKLSS